MRKDGNQCFPMGLIHNTIILPKQKKIYTICVDVRNIVICAGDFKKIIMSEGIFETIRVDFGGSAPQKPLMCFIASKTKNHSRGLRISCCAIHSSPQCSISSRRLLNRRCFRGRRAVRCHPQWRQRHSFRYEQQLRFR